MATFRIQKTENYVVLDKGFLNNPVISWQAKGLLAYMLALPNDWTFSIADLTNRSKNGRDATKAIINELCIAGYIKKEQGRAERGKFGSTQFLVFEIPQPLTENPSTDNPLTEKPLTENPPLLINKLLNNDLLNNNYEDDEEKASPSNPPSAKIETAYSFYQENGFGVLSSHVHSKMNNWIDDLSEELVIHAMKLAVENNAVRWNYVETILKDWFNKRLKSLADVEAARLNFEAKKNQKQPRQQGRKNFGGRREQTPDWFNKPDTPPAEIDIDAEHQRLMKSMGIEV